MRFRPRQGLFVGLAILAAASVVLEIALSRIFAAVLGQHIARVAPTLALFGAGIGGALLYAVPSLVSRPALLSRATHLAGLAAAGTLAALLVVVHVKIPDTLDRASFVRAAIVYLASVLPFAFVGVAFAAALRHGASHAGRVVCSIFTGAAIGAPAAIVVLRVGGLRAGLVVVAADAIAALVFYIAARIAGPPIERPRGPLVATLVLAAGVLLAGDLGAPWLRLPSLRFAALDKTEVQEWSELGLVTVDRAQNGVAWMRTDGTASIPIYEGKQGIPPLPEEMAYILHHDRGPVLVIGAGGGREIRVAERYGQKEIHATEIDPVVTKTLMRGRFKDWSGDVYDKPTVTLALEDGRGYARRAGLVFRNIVIPLPDDQAAVAAGVVAAEPSDLYTVEAFDDLFDHLAPEGTLVVTRWDAELDRLVALTSAALRKGGADDPVQHLFACGASRSTTLLAKKTPLTPREISDLRAFCRRNKLVEAIAPDEAHTEARRRSEAHRARPILHADAAAVAHIDDGAEAPPPTGDRPFFFHTPPPPPRDPKTASPVSGQGILLLDGMLGVTATLAFFAIGMPLAAWPRADKRRRPLMFFAGLGGSFAFAFAALVPRAVTLLGHPVYAFTTVITALFASAAAGGLFAGRLALDRLEIAASRRAELLAAWLAFTAAIFGTLVDGAIALPFGVRLVVALIVLVPIGLGVGSLVTLGARIVDERATSLLPWCWSMCAVSAFAAAAIAAFVAMSLGYAAVILAGGACALLAAATVPRGFEVWNA